MKQEAAARREEVERLEMEAEANRNAPVDDSKIVEQMFGFLPENAQMAEDGEREGCNGTHTHTHNATHQSCYGTFLFPLSSRHGPYATAS